MRFRSGSIAAMTTVMAAVASLAVGQDHIPHGRSHGPGGVDPIPTSAPPTPQPTSTPQPTPTATATPAPTATRREFAEDVQFNKAAHFDSEKANGSSGAAATIDWARGNRQTITLTGSPNCVLTFTPPGGPCSMTLTVTQGSGGGKTATWPGTVWWPNKAAPVLSSAEGAVDVLVYSYTGSVYIGNVAPNVGVPSP